MIVTRSQANILRRMTEGWRLCFLEGDNRGSLLPPEGSDKTPIPLTRMALERLEVKGLIRFQGVRDRIERYEVPGGGP